MTRNWGHLAGQVPTFVCTNLVSSTSPGLGWIGTLSDMLDYNQSPALVRWADPGIQKQACCDGKLHRLPSYGLTVRLGPFIGQLEASQLDTIMALLLSHTCSDALLCKRVSLSYSHGATTDTGTGVCLCVSKRSSSPTHGGLQMGGQLRLTNDTIPAFVGIPPSRFASRGIYDRL